MGEPDGPAPRMRRFGDRALLESIRPVTEVWQSVTGSATNIIAGIVAAWVAAFPIIFIAIAILGAYSFAGLYGIAIAAVGMLANMAFS